jgi:hypothetical protein
MDLLPLPIQELRRMNRYYELVNDIDPRPIRREDYGDPDIDV